MSGHDESRETTRRIWQTPARACAATKIIDRRLRRRFGSDGKVVGKLEAIFSDEELTSALDQRVKP